MPGIHMPRSRRRLVALIATGAVLATLTAVGIYGLVLGAPSARDTAREVSAPPTAAAPETSRIEPHAVPSTYNPLLFARLIAASLFDWDTRTAALSEWEQPVVDIAAPDDAPAVASDVRRYLPGSDAWLQLLAYGTRQSLEITSITEPSTWDEAKDQAMPGQLPSGAAAYTVIGVRLRTGVAGGKTISTSRPLSFTVFIACPIDQPCRLLRLSIVDVPLP